MFGHSFDRPSSGRANASTKQNKCYSGGLPLPLPITIGLLIFFVFHLVLIIIIIIIIII
jgi:hypothetical protein